MPSWLSMHVAYECLHRGACCRARWPIPLEAHRVDLVGRAIEDGRIAAHASWLAPVTDVLGDPGGLLDVAEDGHCVFHRHDPPSRQALRRTRRCAIHGALGHHALPSACQHFPRVCLTDPRGVFVTLSHFCPTAAALLFDNRPVSIVDGPPALPDSGLPEGLDARDAWPPLLTERVLMDHESYGRWEQHMVNVLAGDGSRGTPELALAQLKADAQVLSAWRPGKGPLMDVVCSVSEAPVDLAQRKSGPAFRARPSGASTLFLFDLACRSTPPELTWSAAPADFDEGWSLLVEPEWAGWAPVVCRFLAAHAFGSWLAYQGRSLLAIVRGLDAALAVLRVEAVRACRARGVTLDRPSLEEAIRQADLLLRHHVDRQAFADRLSRH